MIEIRDAAGVSLLLTSVDWTESERNLAMSAVLKLVGFKSAAPVKRQGNKPRTVIRRQRVVAVNYRSLLIHSAPTTVSQTATNAIASTTTAVERLMRSNSPSSSR